MRCIRFLVCLNDIGYSMSLLGTLIWSIVGGQHQLTSERPVSFTILTPIQSETPYKSRASVRSYKVVGYYLNNHKIKTAAQYIGLSSEHRFSYYNLLGHLLSPRELSVVQLPMIERRWSCPSHKLVCGCHHRQLDSITVSNLGASERTEPATWQAAHPTE